MNIRRHLSVAIVVAVLLTGTFLAAQHDHAAASKAPQQNTSDMMKECQKHQSETMSALDQLSETLTEGKQSGDPVKMRAAFDKAEAQLAEAKHHMGMCPMMKGGMHHSNMQHMQQMDGMSGQSAGTENKTCQQ